MERVVSFIAGDVHTCVCVLHCIYLEECACETECIMLKCNLHILLIYVLVQGCSTSGPWTKCSAWSHCIWPRGIPTGQEIWWRESGGPLDGHPPPCKFPKSQAPHGPAGLWGKAMPPPPAAISGLCHLPFPPPRKQG